MIGNHLWAAEPVDIVVALGSHGQCCCQIVAKLATESATRLEVGGLLERTGASGPFGSGQHERGRDWAPLS